MRFHLIEPYRSIEGKYRKKYYALNELIKSLFHHLLDDKDIKTKVDNIYKEGCLLLQSHDMIVHTSSTESICLLIGVYQSVLYIYYFSTVNKLIISFLLQLRPYKNEPEYPIDFIATILKKEHTKIVNELLTYDDVIKRRIKIPLTIDTIYTTSNLLKQNTFPDEDKYYRFAFEEVFADITA